jgi:hypothetical protein
MGVSSTSKKPLNGSEMSSAVSFTCHNANVHSYFTVVKLLELTCSCSPVLLFMLYHVVMPLNSLVYYLVWSLPNVL